MSSKRPESQPIDVELSGTPSREEVKKIDELLEVTKNISGMHNRVTEYVKSLRTLRNETDSQRQINIRCSLYLSIANDLSALERDDWLTVPDYLAYSQTEIEFLKALLKFLESRVSMEQIHSYLKSRK